MGESSRSATAISVLALLIATSSLVLVVLVWVRPELISPQSASTAQLTTLAEQAATDAATQIKTMVEALRSDIENQAVTQRTYTFSYGINYPPTDYLDRNGFLKGLSSDLMTEVCKAAKKNCTHVVRYNPPTCWDSLKKTGEGLQNREVDGCVGFYRTVERSNVFAFVGNMYEPPKGAFYTKVGATVDIATAKIGFRQLFYTDATCLTRNSVTFDADAIYETSAPTWSELVTKLNASEIDVIFAPEDIGLLANLQKLPTTYDCTIGKGGVMVRKDMKNDMMWIHEGLEKIKESGKFQELCDNSLRDHGGANNCLTV
ncbi:uncharacterized protein LOC106151348 isoform X2 [Lingula anatina]|nr:uncharacterized protein LOC106151348 isoform X2 [Lingula anatina]|eukprot:XP_013380036.1 uncharacterized protein LOC106151348 isoform X2 [Lingula anatina]